MCVKYRHLFINIKVWKYSLYSREKIWVGEFPICLVGRIDKVPSEPWSAAALSCKAIKILSILHHILSPSLSFPLCYDCFFLLPFPLSLHGSSWLPLSTLWMSVREDSVQEEKRGDPGGGHSLGTLHFQGKQEPRKGNTQGDTDKGAEMLGVLG